MVHTIKKSTSLLTLSLLLAAVVGILPITPARAQQPTRHVYLEEFTGSWCGYCVRGAWAIQQLLAKYPGQVIPVCIHQNGSSTEIDPMINAQGDSITAGIGFPIQDQYGFPDGWTARTLDKMYASSTNPAGDWNVDPGAWADSGQELFENTAYAPGIVDSFINQPALAQCTVTNVSFNSASQTITATVSATFDTAISGDFRFNLMVTEDSISGPAGSLYDQHNYYSSTDIGPSYPNNPMYNQPFDITGWQHMHVFRYAAGGIHGADGIIPATTTKGGNYSTTFTFKIPSDVLNPNQVHLVGLVHQFSATNAADNQVFDAMEVPLTIKPIAYAANNISVVGANGSSTWAHAGGDTTMELTVSNENSDTETVSLQMDPTAPLPAGWSVKFNPSSVTLSPGGGQTQNVAMVITAPEQSNYIAPNVIVTPQKAGIYIPLGSFQFTALSDNTTYAIYAGFAGLESAAVYGLPDSMAMHTAIMPWDNSDILGYFDPSQFGSPINLCIFSDFPWFDGAESENGSVSPLPTVLNLLGEGKPVYISSNDALAWAYAGNTNTETDAVQGFFNDSLGINYKKDVSRQTSNGYVAFTINGTTDPIASGMASLNANNTGALAPIGETPLFSLSAGSPSTVLFYTDGVKTNYSSLKCQSPSGWKLVYMGFDLDGLVNQTDADTIFHRSIEWLLAGAAAGVNPMPSSPATGITASPNPFHGATDISYTAAQGEENVTLAAYDVLGREVAQLPMHDGGNNTFTASFDGSSLPTGTYVIIAHSSKGSSQVRVVNQQ